MIAPSIAVALWCSVAAPPGRARAIKRIDRAHIVGSPVLDKTARPGLYIWREDGRFQFAAVGRTSIRFEVISTEPIRASIDEGMVWERLGPRRFLGRGVAARGAIATRGRIKVGRARRGSRRARIYLGPLAERGAKAIEIGAFGALKR